MHFIKDGYRKKTEQDRVNFGIQLKQALDEFTDSFLPHMQEEEEVYSFVLEPYVHNANIIFREFSKMMNFVQNLQIMFGICAQVFQPLLLQYFSYEELRELRQKVLQKHFEKEEIELFDKQPKKHGSVS